MNKHETKFHNTHKKICQALLELLETTEYENITVSAICEQARLYRTTFYAHFQNIAEILDVINDGLLEKFLRENNINRLTIFDPKSFTYNPYIILNREDLSKLLTFIKSHTRLYLIIVTHRSILRLGLPENDIEQNIFLPTMAKMQRYTAKDLSYVFEFYVAGIQKILAKWILGNCAESEKEILEIFDLCLNKRPYKTMN